MKTRFVWYGHPCCATPSLCSFAAQTPIPPFHSLFSSELWFLFAPTARCAAFGVIGTAPSAKEKQKRDMQLDHLRAPIFVFIRKTTSPSPSSLRDATSPKVRGFGITEKHFGFARGSPFEERLPPRRGKMSRSDKRGNLPSRARLRGRGCRPRRVGLSAIILRSPPAFGTPLPRRP